MKCPECENSGQRSVVYRRVAATTCMGWEPFYDEDGHLHIHNPNGSGIYFECSHGHEFWPEPASCPAPGCDWFRGNRAWRGSHRSPAQGIEAAKPARRDSGSTNGESPGPEGNAPK